MSSIKQYQIMPHHSNDVESVIEKISTINVKSSYYLVVLSGRYQKGKEDLLSRITKRVGEINSVDMRTIVTADEEESYQKIDKLFNSLTKEDRYLYLENSDVLSGEYTGFSYSTHRYPTPQEKYLMNKIKSSEKIVLMDLVDKGNVHNTLKRFTQTIIEFDGPTNLIGKLIWRLKQIKIQGHTFENKRELA